MENEEKTFQENKLLMEELLNRGLYVNPVTRSGENETIEYLVVSCAEPRPLNWNFKATVANFIKFTEGSEELFQLILNWDYINPQQEQLDKITDFYLKNLERKEGHQPTPGK